MDISNISAMYQNYNQTAAGSATGNQISQLQEKICHRQQMKN